MRKSEFWVVFGFLKIENVIMFGNVLQRFFFCDEFPYFFLNHFSFILFFVNNNVFDMANEAACRPHTHTFSARPLNRTSMKSDSMTMKIRANYLQM